MTPVSFRRNPRRGRGRDLSILAAGCLAAIALPGSASGAAPMGFSPDHARLEAEAERKFDADLNPADQRAWMKLMTSEPNNVGTPKDKANAEFMLEQFRAWGWDARIETFYCLYPTPIRHALELVAPTRYSVRLTEPPVPGDRTSTQVDKELPAYNAYGADGDVTAELVYVNYGMPADYEELARHGVSVKGRIVIARYGVGWRGLKPKLAQEHGAVGCIIYSDPRDEGYSKGETYPEGPWRPPQGIQRGSVMDIPVYPGDPLTPGIGATQGARRLSIAEARTILKIMCVPIGYGEARPLLAALRGPVAPESWRGSLPLTYHIGPGPARVHLQIASDWSLKPVYDVIAVMRGSEFPDEWVVRGNHHDGWVFGAYDPISANVSMMSEAKAIGALAKTGWRPRRTLVYCGWDGEEPGLLGSTEWAETHADELQKKAVIYINSDCYGRGWLNVSGSQELEHFVNQATDDVRDPETGASVTERRRAVGLVQAYRKGDELPPLDGDVRIGALGGGSDFTVFLQHLGIASLDMQIAGEWHSAGVYHSAYDSFDDYVRFVEPDFAGCLSQSKTAGRLVLRAGDADILPMRFGDFADAIGIYLREIRHLADKTRTETEAFDRLVKSNAFKMAADPSETYVAPEAKEKVPNLDFSPLEKSLAKVRQSADSYDRAYEAAAGGGLLMTEAQRGRLNDLLQGIEQTLLDPEGLPGRPWYRHLIYASGLYTGYDTKTLPGVREAVEQRKWDEAAQFIVRTAAVLDAFSRRLDEASAELGGGSTAGPGSESAPPRPAPFAAAESPQPVVLTASSDRVRVEIGGRLFTEYIFSGAHRPYFYPVVAADGTPLTRDYPMKDTPGEDHDHVHHRSLWFADSSVGGVDFWNEETHGHSPKGMIVHDALLEASGGAVGVIRARDRWVGPDARLICTDDTVVRVQGTEASRTLDYEVTLHALPDSPLRIGDNKDGAMAIRVAQWMTLPHVYEKRNLPGVGHILASTGARDGGAWGKHADWCDYYAARGGRIYGIALFDDPRNPGHPPWWMARPYGLFAANPFGLGNYDSIGEKPSAGDHVVPAGGSLTLRYRFYFHFGDPDAADVAGHYREFAAGR